MHIINMCRTRQPIYCSLRLWWSWSTYRVGFECYIDRAYWAMKIFVHIWSGLVCTGCGVTMLLSETMQCSQFGGGWPLMFWN